MASRLLETIRSSILDSIKGRKLGIDPYGFLAGAPDIANQFEDLLNSTAASSISYYGYTRVGASGSTQGPVPDTLQAPPYAGIRKTVFQGSSSTGIVQVQLSGGAVIQGGTLGTATSTMFALLKQNAVINLLSLSSAIWQQVDRNSSLASSDSAGVVFTTST